MPPISVFYSDFIVLILLSPTVFRPVVLKLLYGYHCSDTLAVFTGDSNGQEFDYEV